MISISLPRANGEYHAIFVSIFDQLGINIKQGPLPGHVQIVGC